MQTTDPKYFWRVLWYQSADLVCIYGRFRQSLLLLKVSWGEQRRNGKYQSFSQSSRLHLFYSSFFFIKLKRLTLEFQQSSQLIKIEHILYNFYHQALLLLICYIQLYHLALFLFICYIFNLLQIMDDDEFNDFQQPVQTYAEGSLKDNTNVEPVINEQVNLGEHDLSSSPPPLDLPSYSLATQSLEPQTGDIESNSFGDASYPQMGKIQSEKQTTNQHVFLELQKNHSQQNPKIDRVYNSDSFFSQKQVFTSEIDQNHNEYFAYQQIKNNKLEEKQLNNGVFYLKSEVQPKELSIQTGFFPSNTLQQQKTEVKQPNQGKQQADRELEDKEINQQTFKLQHNQDPILLDQDNLNKDAKQYKSNDYQTNQQSETIKQSKQNPFTSQVQPTQQLQNEKAQIDQDQQQFGDFQQTVPNAQENNQQIQQKVQQSQQKQQEKIEVYEEQQPSKLNHRTKEQQLAQFVNSLPDYSFLFVQSFQSF